jgi:hypothetical protein
VSRNGHFDLGQPMGTAYAPDAQGSAEERRALGTSYAPDAQGSAEERRALGDINPLNAEANRTEQRGLAGELVIADVRRDYFYNRPLEGLREDDTGLRFLSGLREEDTKLRFLSGLREEDAAMKFSVGDLRMTDYGLTLQGLRNSIILRGLNEDWRKAQPYTMGNRMTYGAGPAGADGLSPENLYPVPYHIMGDGERAADYYGGDAMKAHKRFPVSVLVQGLGVVNGEVLAGRLGGLFDFLSPGMDWPEFQSRCSVLNGKVQLLLQRINALPAASRAAIFAQADKLGVRSMIDGTLQIWLDDGPTGLDAHQGRIAALKKDEAAYSSIENLTAQMAAGLPPGQATAATKAHLDNQIAQVSGGFMATAVPVGAALLAGGILTALVLSLG